MPASTVPKKFLAALLVLASICASAAESFSSLEERMSYKEFKDFGLDHLSPEQLRGLNAWLQAHASGGSAMIGPTSVSAASVAPTAAAPVDETVVSRIAGPFNGWHQGTILTLENGQRWEVRDDETVYAHDEGHPRVTIEKGGLMSGWRLSVEGRNDLVHVVPASRQ